MSVTHATDGMNEITVGSIRRRRRPRFTYNGKTRIVEPPEPLFDVSLPVINRGRALLHMLFRAAARSVPDSG